MCLLIIAYTMLLLVQSCFLKLWSVWIWYAYLFVFIMIVAMPVEIELFAFAQVPLMFWCISLQLLICNNEYCLFMWNSNPSLTLNEMIVMWMLRMFVCAEDQPLISIRASYFSLCVAHVCNLVGKRVCSKGKWDKHHFVTSMHRNMFSVPFMFTMTNDNSLQK